MKIGIISSHELALKLIERMEKHNDFLCGAIGEVLGERYFSSGPEKLMKALLAELWPDQAHRGDTIYFRQAVDHWPFLPEESRPLRLAFLSRILRQPDRQLCWLKGEAK